jgi:NADH dehydrogenase [ubiquinone] 1 alpha subcomplex assembly factor 7
MSPRAAEALPALIRARIARDGPIAVADYMALALAHPGHGYYRTRDPLGVAGDFITAPEISQAFGELIGLWCAAAWRQADAPTPVALVELGPGRGTLMADALRAVRVMPAFREALHVHLVETSAPLRDRQRRALGAEPVTWHDSLDSVPGGPMLLIANEFFDALPVHQYVMAAGAWHERLVTLDGEGFRFAVAGRPAESGMFPEAVRGAPEGAIFERCPAALRLAGAIAERLAGDGIAALIVDYGPARTAAGESLQAVRDHGYAEVLTAPGAADLTAHVDFQSLAAAARDRGAATFGPVTQRTLLTRLGIGVRARRLADGKDAAHAAAIHAACERLIDGDGMGTLFKAIALTHPRLGLPPGFEATDPY